MRKVRKSCLEHGRAKPAAGSVNPIGECLVRDDPVDGAAPDVIADQLYEKRVAAGGLGGSYQLRICDSHSGAGERLSKRCPYVGDGHVGEVDPVGTAKERRDVLIEKIRDGFGDSGHEKPNGKALTDEVLDIGGKIGQLRPVHCVDLVDGEKHPGLVGVQQGQKSGGDLAPVDLSFGRQLCRDTDATWPGRLPPDVESFILAAVEMIHELDDTSLHEMTPLFYQHGYEQVKMSLVDLLKFLGHDPDT